MQTGCVQADRNMKAGQQGTGRWVKKGWTGYTQTGTGRLDWVQADRYRKAELNTGRQVQEGWTGYRQTGTGRLSADRLGTGRLSAEGWVQADSGRLAGVQADRG